MAAVKENATQPATKSTSKKANTLFGNYAVSPKNSSKIFSLLSKGHHDISLATFKQSMNSFKLNSSRRSADDSQHVEEKNYHFVLMPDSPIRLRWDMMILCFVIYFGVSVPLRMAFEEYMDPSEVDDAIEDLGLVIFVIDIVLNFRTAVKVQGVIVRDPGVIARCYLRTWFLIDFIATIPIDSILGDRNGVSINKVLRLLRIFKLFRVFRIARILQRIEEFTKFNPSMLRLVKLFVSMMFSWHWIACCYWYISDLEYFGFEDETFSEPAAGFNRERGNQWVPPPELWCSGDTIDAFKCNETAYKPFELVNGYNPFKGIDYCIAYGHCNANFVLMYANSFFWAVMVTTGIGRDIMPVSALEHVFSTIIILVGVMMYAVIIGSASSALSSLDSDSTAKRKKLEAVNQFMRQRQVPMALRKKVREYYEYMWSSHQSINGEEGMMAELHETLRLQLRIALNRKLIHNIPIFNLISDTRCLISIIEKLTPRIFIPGEFICLAGEIGTEMYIIVRGTVHILVGGDLRFLAALSNGDVFGEQSLLTRSKRNASIRAITYCETLILNQTDFDEVLQEFPEFFDTLQKSTKRGSSDHAWAQLSKTLDIVHGVRSLGVKVNMRDILLSETTLSTVVGQVSDQLHAASLQHDSSNLGQKVKGLASQIGSLTGSFGSLSGSFGKTHGRRNSARS